VVIRNVEFRITTGSEALEDFDMVHGRDLSQQWEQ
jgi:hypothetical protein